MQEHLIPQDISSYKFHLIGEIDLKQFTEIMIGVVIAVIAYRLSLPTYIRYPIMFFSVTIGLVAAFIPLGERPLSHWIRVFGEKLLAPSKFYWKKTTVVPSFFDFELSDRHKAFLEHTTTFNPLPVKQHRALDYFGTLEKDPSTQSDPLELFAPDKINEVVESATIKLPSTKQQAAVVVPTAAPKKMILRPDVRTDQTQRNRQIFVPSQKTLEQFLSNSSIFAPVDVTEQITGVDNAATKLAWPTADAPTPPTAAPAPDATPITASATDSSPSSPSQPSPVAPSPAAPIIPEIPSTNLNIDGIFTPRAVSSGLVIPNSGAAPSPNPAPPPVTPIDLPPLSTLKQFNLSGRLVDRYNQPLDNVVINVKDTHNQTRAIIKSDTNGAFHLNEVLDPGNYVLGLQKDNFSFPETFISIEEDGIAPLLLSTA